MVAVILRCFALWAPNFISPQAVLGLKITDTNLNHECAFSTIQLVLSYEAFNLFSILVFLIKYY